VTSDKWGVTGDEWRILQNGYVKGRSAQGEVVEGDAEEEVLLLRPLERLGGALLDGAAGFDQLRCGRAALLRSPIIWAEQQFGPTEGDLPCRALGFGQQQVAILEAMQ
jgi:hypothetical protein